MNRTDFPLVAWTFVSDDLDSTYDQPTCPFIENVNITQHAWSLFPFLTVELS